MPRLTCIGSRVACAEGGCAAPLPRGCSMVVGESALDTLCGGWVGKRPDCICIVASSATVHVHIVELKEARLIASGGGAGLRQLIQAIVAKAESSIGNLSRCVKAASVESLVVVLPFELAPAALAPRIAGMVAAGLRSLLRNR